MQMFDQQTSNLLPLKHTLGRHDRFVGGNRIAGPHLSEQMLEPKGKVDPLVNCNLQYTVNIFRIDFRRGKRLSHRFTIIDSAEIHPSLA